MVKYNKPLFFLFKINRKKRAEQVADALRCGIGEESGGGGGQLCTTTTLSFPSPLPKSNSPPSRPRLRLSLCLLLFFLILLSASPIFILAPRAASPSPPPLLRTAVRRPPAIPDRPARLRYSSTDSLLLQFVSIVFLPSFLPSDGLL